MISRTDELAATFIHSLDGAHDRLQIFASKVVGCQYYNGLAFTNETVILIRDPFNMHDNNAIRAYDCRGIHMGYLPRDLAAQLAPLMDSGVIDIRGVSGEQEHYECPVYLMIHEKIGSE